MKMKHKNNALLSESPAQSTFNFADHQPELMDCHSCSTSNTSHNSGSNTNLANVTQLAMTLTAAFSQSCAP